VSKDNIEKRESKELKGYDINEYEIRIPGSKDPADLHPVEEALYKKVGNVVAKEMLDRSPQLFDKRNFPAQDLNTRLFDFIRVIDVDEELPDRFLIMLYADRYRNYYFPRYDVPSSWVPYPMSLSVQDKICEGFREDLERGEIPTPAWHQIAVGIGPGGGDYFNFYYPCCVEVTEQGDIEEIEELVQQAVELGVRPDIITGTTESMKDILARVANDDSLPDFDYMVDFHPNA
jgi:hypothetical protein